MIYYLKYPSCKHLQILLTYTHGFVTEINSVRKIDWFMNKWSKYLLDGVAALLYNPNWETIAHLGASDSLKCSPARAQGCAVLPVQRAPQPHTGRWERLACRITRPTPRDRSTAGTAYLCLQMQQDSLTQLEAHCGETHPASIQCCLNAGCPTAKGTLLTNHFPLYILFY